MKKLNSISNQKAQEMVALITNVHSECEKTFRLFLTLFLIRIALAISAFAFPCKLCIFMTRISLSISINVIFFLI